MDLEAPGFADDAETAASFKARWLLVEITAPDVWAHWPLPIREVERQPPASQRD